MVCPDCEKKQAKVITPDVWKAGARNTAQFVLISFHFYPFFIFHFISFLFHLYRGGGRVGGANRLLENNGTMRARLLRGKGPYRQTCRLCRKSLSDAGVYCQECAHKLGVCSMCGKKLNNPKDQVRSSK